MSHGAERCLISGRDVSASRTTGAKATTDGEHDNSIKLRGYSDVSSTIGPTCQDDDRKQSDKYMAIKSEGPFCEQCAEERNIKTNIDLVYCHDCYQFLCSDCRHGNHGNSSKFKGHMIKEGNLMPKSMADKPSRHLKYCLHHHDQIMDKFCHCCRTLICPKCLDQYHSACTGVVKL